MSGRLVVHTTRVLDELVTDDGAVLLVSIAHGHRVLRVSPLAQAVRELARDGMSLSDLETEVAHRFGRPPTSTVEEAMVVVVESLVEQGVVTVAED